MKEKGKAKEKLMDFATVVVFGCVVFMSALVFGSFDVADTVALALCGVQVVGLTLFGSFAMRLMSDAAENAPAKARRLHLFCMAVGLMMLILATGAR